MEIVNVPITEIKPYDNNPRDNSKGIEQVAKSIKEFGWQQPVVIDVGGVIIVGHTRYEAAKLLGLTEVPCVIAKDLSEEKVRAYRLADNKTSDFSIWDNKKLLEELSALGDDIFTGFETSETFDELLDESDDDVLRDNTDGVIYEVVFKSQNREVIDEVVSFWEGLPHE